jgi:signal transduction histidine kinase
MEAQDKLISGILASEVIAALVDLARISHRADLTRGDAPGTTAALLLERLLTLCGAQRGAVLVSMQDGEKPHPSSREAFRIFALHGMNEEKALALVTTFSTEDGVAPRFIEGVQSPPGVPCWLICRLPISRYLPGGQVSPSSEQEPIAHQQANWTEQQGHTFFPFYALLVLGWDGNDACACIAATKKGQTVLPFVADSAGSALMNILLVEHIAELEAPADSKGLHEMELLKAELLATVSHELRSPLASIKGYAATLLRHERRISREERHEFLLAITQASDHLAVVIDRLLEISQLETSSISIERSIVNLAYLVREAITAIELRLGASEDAGREANTSKRFTFTLRLEDRLGNPSSDEPIIWADRYRLRELLDNLFENSINYSPEGGKIEVVVRPLLTPGLAVEADTLADRDDGSRNSRIPVPQTGFPIYRVREAPPSAPESQQMVEICVRDTGIGIPSAHLKRIFDRFHRVDTRLTREVNGLGLGLSICKRIVELHGGVIWAESEVGTGSAFHVWLPVDERT